jgi:hypothetical protein
MPESSQPRTHSNLSQMTRVDPSDSPESDSMVESPYYENMQTVSIPTKSGTEVAIRSHDQSDDRPSTSGLSSRPSSIGGELDHEDAKIIQNCYVPPSIANLDVKPSKFVKLRAIRNQVNLPNLVKVSLQAHSRSRTKSVKSQLAVLIRNPHLLRFHKVWKECSLG